VSDFIHPIPSRIYFYEEGDLDGLNFPELGRYLEEKTRIPFRIRGNIYEGLSEKRIGEVAQRIARIKVKDPGKRYAEGTPFQAEVDYEKRRIRDPQWNIIGILYEGVLYQ